MLRIGLYAWLLSLIVAGSFLIPSGSAAETGERHLLYVTVPDMVPGATKHKPGIMVYDIDNDHKLLKFLEIPHMGATRGACGCVQGRIYISHSNTSIICYDFINEKVLWENVYKPEEGGCDRASVTPDGKKVYVPEGWWTSATKSMRVLDGETGKLIKSIPIGVGSGHNTIVSADGKLVYLGPVRNGTLFTIDTATDEVISRIGPFGGKPDDTLVGTGGRASPFTINSAGTLCFVNSHNVGFYVGDLKERKILSWTQVDGAKGYSHGVSLTPDEKEIWLANPDNKKVQVYDGTKMPPVWKESIDVSAVTHGWILFSQDSRFAWCDTGDIIDPKTKKIVATWKDEEGKQVHASKFFEVDFKDGKPFRVGDATAVGRAGAQ